MFRALSVLVIGFSAIALQSCATEPEDTFRTTGIIAYRSDVGDFMGFYFIAGDDGGEYYPTNLPDECQRKGIRIRFEARELPKTGHIAGWGGGPVIELLHIQEISP